MFDLDGTLTDPFEGITKSFQYALNYYGIDVPTCELSHVIGPPLTDSFSEVYGFDEEKSMEAAEKYRERFNVVGWKENRLLDGVPEMLRELRANGKVLALATSKPYKFAKKIIDYYEIADYFDVAIGSKDDGSGGTKREIITATLEALGNPPLEQAAMVGDRKYDIYGAKQCGVASVGVRVGYAQIGELEEAGADYIVDTIEDLKELLLG